MMWYCGPRKICIWDARVGGKDRPRQREGEELKIQVPKSDAKSVDGNGDTEAAAECNEAEKRPGGSLQASVPRRRWWSVFRNWASKLQETQRRDRAWSKSSLVQRRTVPSLSGPEKGEETSPRERTAEESSLQRTGRCQSKWWKEHLPESLCLLGGFRSTGSVRIWKLEDNRG